MADVSVKARAGSRWDTNGRRKYRGKDCPDGQKSRHTVAERIEFEQHRRRRHNITIPVFAGFDDVADEASAVHLRPKGYVKPNNGSGYYYMYMTDGKFRRTFHCSDAFQYPPKQIENIADELPEDFALSPTWDDEDDDAMGALSSWLGQLPEQPGRCRKVTARVEFLDGHDANLSSGITRPRFPDQDRHFRRQAASAARWGVPFARLDDWLPKWAYPH